MSLWPCPWGELLKVTFHGGVTCQFASLLHCDLHKSGMSCKKGDVPKSVWQESVRQECLTRVSSMILSRYSTRMSRKSTQQVSPIRVSRKRFLSRESKRVSGKNASQGCPIREFSNVGAFGFVGSISFFGEIDTHLWAYPSWHLPTYLHSINGSMTWLTWELCNLSIPPSIL